MLLRVFAMYLALGLALSAADVSGTWKFNAQKSTYTGLAKPKQATIVYTKQGDGWAYDMKGVYPDGKPVATTFRYSKDGEEIALTGSPLADTLVLKNGNGDVATGVFKRGGKVVGTVKRTISNVHKTMTIEGSTVLADGTKATYIAVYDRQ